MIEYKEKSGAYSEFMEYIETYRSNNIKIIRLMRELDLLERELTGCQDDMPSLFERMSGEEQKEIINYLDQKKILYKINENNDIIFPNDPDPNED